MDIRIREYINADKELMRKHGMIFINVLKIKK